MIDTHCHLNDEQFAADRDAVVARALADGLKKLICIGTTLSSSREAIRLAESHASVHAAVGIHPNSCADAAPGDWDAIVALLDHPRVVALGETGLDRHWDFAPIALQMDYFERHIRLAQERDLPFIVHCREAEAETMPMLRAAAARGPLRGIMHAFGGDVAMASECVALGLHVSFAGNVTYTNKKFQSLRDAAISIPADRILIETDSPYLTPEPLRGKQRRNEPANVAHTAAALAVLRGVERADFIRQTTANAWRLFRLHDAE